MNYIPANNEEADQSDISFFFNKFTFRIVERVIPRLSHINPSVAFSAIKLIVKYFNFLNNPEIIRKISEKVSTAVGKYLFSSLI